MRSTIISFLARLFRLCNVFFRNEDTWGQEYFILNVELERRHPAVVTI
jgi:hypothetical protein